MPNILFREIAECRSLNQIDYLIECSQHVLNEGGVFTPDEIAAIDKIYASNDLDEIHLICADVLGDTDHAAALHTWLVEKAKRANR